MKVTSCLYCSSKKLKPVNHRSDNIKILECAVCHVMMVDQISDDTEQLYTADYFEKDEATKNGYTNYLSSPVANMIGKYGFTSLFAQKPCVHLDLGCADGSLMEIFKSEGYTTQGLEISKDAVAIANQKGLDVSFSNLHAFPKHTAKSHVITAFDLLEHADKPGNVLKEVYSNLEKDGYFVFSTLSVKKEDSGDYWFNNSLEHYVYYDAKSISYILEDVFGKDSYDFVEMKINGISEFWGFAKKGKLTFEREIIATIKSGGYFADSPELSYKLSLFYNQLSHFSENEKVMSYFANKWNQLTSLYAEFYSYYYQGKYEKAVALATKNKHVIPASGSVFWQALDFCTEQLQTVKTQEMTSKYDGEIVDLKGQIFKLKDELHRLRNSRIVGKVIRSRERIGDIKRNYKQYPRKIVVKTKRKVSGVTPEFVKPPIRAVVVRPARKVLAIQDRRRHKNAATYQMSVSEIENETWKRSTCLVSVVIPYYNRADTIDDTLTSLRKQSFQNFEVIIVNDGSSETASIEKLKELADLDQDYILVNQKNQGVAAARNTGIAQASGKYVVCLDSDDMLEPTYLEKCAITLERNTDISLVTTYRKDFGVINEATKTVAYDPAELYNNNMVTTAAMFRKSAWLDTKGYKSGIGYEDWEFWLSLAEQGHWGVLLPEFLFLYRVAMVSRFVQDKEAHWNNVKLIQNMHKQYVKKIEKIARKRRAAKFVATPETTFVNMNNPMHYAKSTEGNKQVLVTIPWMTFGGAETLIYNYCREIKNDFTLTFVTGLESQHEWEYKFRELTPNIYHLTNLFDDSRLYLEFLSNYISTRNVEILHVIHNGFTFEMLPELKRRHPKLKVIVTMFNDRVEHFDKSLAYEDYIDVFTSDNMKVTNHYKKELGNGIKTVVIPNGVDCYTTFKPELYDREHERRALGLQQDDLAVFFVGRLSEEKNPDKFVSVAHKVVNDHKKKNIAFYVIGDGPMRDQITDAIKKVGSGVTYLGYQSEVARFLSAADVFVLPSSIEGFPLSIPEAMAMRVAVIASDVGAVSEVVEDSVSGYVVSPGSVDEIAKSVEHLNENRTLLHDMKLLSRKKVEDNYSNTILGKRYAELYRKK